MKAWMQRRIDKRVFRGVASYCWKDSTQSIGNEFRDVFAVSNPAITAFFNSPSRFLLENSQSDDPEYLCLELGRCVWIKGTCRQSSCPQCPYLFRSEAEKAFKGNTPNARPNCFGVCPTSLKTQPAVGFLFWQTPGRRRHSVFPPCFRFCSQDWPTFFLASGESHGFRRWPCS